MNSLNSTHEIDTNYKIYKNEFKSERTKFSQLHSHLTFLFYFKLERNLTSAKKIPLLALHVHFHSRISDFFRYCCTLLYSLLSCEFVILELVLFVFSKRKEEKRLGGKEKTSKQAEIVCCERRADELARKISFSYAIQPVGVLLYNCNYKIRITHVIFFFS